MATTSSITTRSRSLQQPSGRAQLPPPSLSAPQGLAPALVPGPSLSSSASSSAPTLPSSGPSNVSIFLTNLRLLEMDQLPDWPDITPQTFMYGTSTTTASAQGQKKRVQCVEWALVRLFELWDSEETKTKLLPLFPPVDQVQSVALRAALLRLLEQAKKNGDLGRDVLVRKTMLDECKGERFEEVLAIFSSMVLKKVVAGGGFGESHPALAQTLALENRGYAEEKTELAILTLAHRVSLQKTLREKNEARERFADFSHLLDAKERAINHRAEKAKTDAAQRDDDSDIPSEDIWEVLRNNWTGDERWIEALRFGDAKAASEGLLGMPFSRVWRRVEAGRLGELEEEEGTNAGLLEQLEGRVKSQQDRLEKWKVFREGMQAPGPDGGINPPTKSPEKAKTNSGIDLGFKAHESLRAARLSPRKASISAQPKGSLDGEYAEMVQGLLDELAGLRSGSMDGLKLLQPPVLAVAKPQPRRTAEPESIEAEHNGVEEPAGFDEPTPKPQRRSVDLKSRIASFRSSRGESHVPRGESALSRSTRSASSSQASPTPSPPQSPKQPASPIRSPRRATTMRSPIGSPIGSPVRSPGGPLGKSPSSSPGRSPGRSSVKTTVRPPVRRVAPMAIPSSINDSPIQPSPTQQLANEILASVNNASPSPLKRPEMHTRQLSLSERTRLSMARTATSNRSKYTSVSLDDESFMDEGETTMTLDLDMVPPSPCPPPSSARQVPRISEPDNDEDDLVARTRRSMAGFEAAQQKARLDRRNSQRKEKEAKRAIAGTGRATKESWFDQVAEEAMEQESSQLEGDTTMLTEELIGGQEDYEAIFKSRPRLKTSPVVSRVSSAEWRD